MTTENAFAGFTNLYELSKTLRFELRATDDTTQEIIDGNTFELDIIRQEKRRLLLSLIDELLGKFIDNLFLTSHLDNISFKGYYQEYCSNKGTKNKKEYEYHKENKLITKITDLYSNTVNIPEIQQNITFENLLKEDILLYIQQIKLGDSQNFTDEQNKIAETLSVYHKKFSTLQDYIKSRKETVFSKQAKTGSLVNRIVRENLKKFFQNKDEYEKIFQLFINNQLEFIKGEFRFLPEDSLLDGKDIFSLDYYKHCFTQSGIDKYNEKIGKLRSKLNNIVQEIKNENKKRKKSDNSEAIIYQPKMNALKKFDKQILGKKDRINQDSEIKSVEEFFTKLSELYFQDTSGEKNIKNIETHILNFLSQICVEKNDYDIKKVYLSKRSIETLSGKFFNDFSFIGKILPGKSEKGKTKLNDFYSLEQIQNSLKKFASEKENQEIDSSVLFKEKYYKENESNKKVIDEQSKDYFLNFIKSLHYELHETFSNYYKESIHLNKLLDTFNKSENIGELQSEANILIVQGYVKASLDIYRMIAYFFPMKKTKEGMQNIKTKDEEDENLYDELHLYFDDNIIVNYFNLFRNFASKKPYSTRKVQVTFDTPTLLTGWQESNGSMQYKGVILKDNTKYYLGILKKGTTSFNLEKHKDVFNQKLNEGDYYEFMNYKQAKWGNNIVNNYGNTYNAKFPDDIKNFGEKKVIENFQEILKKYVCNFPQLQTLIENKSYNSVDNLKTDFEDLNLYKIEFLKIEKSYVDNLDGFYKFQIYSKDFSNSQEKDKSSQVDQQTNYFVGLFDSENLNNVAVHNGLSIFKLEGLSKLFFREKTEKLPNREKNGAILKYIDKIDNNKEKIVKQNRRFSENKLLFHFTMKLNYGQNTIKTIDEYNNSP